MGMTWDQAIGALTAPGQYTGYGAKTLPGVREALELGKFEEAVAQGKELVAALEKFNGALAEAVRSGFATASTDTGHPATSGIDASWALQHPEKIIDFGHRAIHLTAVQGKAIAAAYYGTAPKKSYFSSCSNGGRQALMEAQRYPNDFDGIVDTTARAMLGISMPN